MNTEDWWDINKEFKDCDGGENEESPFREEIGLSLTSSEKRLVEKPDESGKWVVVGIVWKSGCKL